MGEPSGSPWAIPMRPLGGFPLPPIAGGSIIIITTNTMEVFNA
ncbi:hypothetical protein [Brucella pseudintermedia]|nr:hypothetical protein [Brucella pseudintermedia]